jgi:bleomycin hydrolase
MQSRILPKCPPCLVALILGITALGTAQTTTERVRADLEKIPHPQSVADFQAAPGLPCQNQNKTLICWSFATGSFLESEMIRLKLPPVRLSVMYPAYCQYIEKARRFVQTKGASRVSPGDIFCGVLDVCQQYGAMPAEAYEKTPDSKAFDQKRLYKELDEYVQQVKARGHWDEAEVVGRVKEILNQHLGEPPRSFSFKGKTCTPQSFLAETVRLPWSEYVNVTSFETGPFSRFIELKVPDNWRHNTNFFNVPLPVFYEAFKQALRSGYTVAVEMDNTEPCYEATGRYCFIPESDIPAQAIDQAAREIRFVHGATSDDHAIQITGWGSVGGQDWFLAKDSWKVAWRNNNRGELFIHGDYVKLKVLAFVVHRDGVPQVKALLPGS